MIESELRRYELTLMKKEIFRPFHTIRKTEHKCSDGCARLHVVKKKVCGGVCIYGSLETRWTWS